VSGITKHWDEFDQPARKQVAVEEPKEHEPLRCAHLLAPKAFRSRREWVEADDPRPEIWRACQRPVTAVGQRGRGCGRPKLSAPALVYIVEGFAKCWRALAPLELNQV
jgi:hypothetical protein